MAQNSFRPYKGKWLLKKVKLTASVAAVEKGDLIGLNTADTDTKELATVNSVAIVGIAAQNSATSASIRTISVFVPNEPKSEMIGKITAGVAVVGTDAHRVCEVQTHEGADVDNHAIDHLMLVGVTIATADGSVTAGEGIFRIVRTPEFARAG